MDKYKCYFFDLDFTLVDASEGIHKCINYALSELSHPEVSILTSRETIGLSLEKTYESLTLDHNPIKGQIFEKYFLKQAHIDLINYTYLLEDALLTLNEIKSNNFPIAIITNKYRHALNDIIAKFNLENIINFSISGDEMIHKKPHPESILTAINYFGTDRFESVYIGDSPVDAEAAYNAGIDFIGITTGMNKRSDLQAYPHVKIISSLKELFT